MWLERFVIVVSEPARDFLLGWNTATLPSTFSDYGPSWAARPFFALIFLFMRILPAISIFEVEELAHEEGRHSAAAAALRSARRIQGAGAARRGGGRAARARIFEARRLHAFPVPELDEPLAPRDGRCPGSCWSAASSARSPPTR